MAACGAKTRAGGKCGAPAMPNGRCRVHGGPSKGNPAPVGNQYASKHGIYGKTFSSEEIDLIPELDASIGSVEQELRIAKLQLNRALVAQKAADELDDGLELDERAEREGAGEYVARDERKYKRRDYPAIIDRLISRIESLEKTRKELLKDHEPIGDDVTRDDTFIAPDEAPPSEPIL